MCLQGRKYMCILTLIRPVQIAWALNKGVKQEYKQFWDVDLGVTYIPWEKVKLDDLDGFAEGGMIDQETVNSGERTGPTHTHTRLHTDSKHWDYWLSAKARVYKQDVNILQTPHKYPHFLAFLHYPCGFVHHTHLLSCLRSHAYRKSQRNPTLER